MNRCMVNEQGELLEIIQEDREPVDGEFKVLLDGYYERLNDDRYPSTRWEFKIKDWVGVGEPIPLPEAQPSEVEILKIQLAQQNQMVSDLMDVLFTHVPELTTL